MKVMNCPHCGKVLPKEFWHEPDSMDRPVVKCSQCGSIRNVRDGKECIKSGVFQRYHCIDCGRRFTKH